MKEVMKIEGKGGDADIERTLRQNYDSLASFNAEARFQGKEISWC